MRIFEASLFDYWTKAKVDFYKTIGLRASKSVIEEEQLLAIYQAFYQYFDQPVKPLHLSHTKSLFLFIIYCNIFYIIVLLFENFYFKSGMGRSSISKR